MPQEVDEAALLNTKETLLREALESYVTSVRLKMDNAQRRERIMRNLIEEERKARQEGEGESERILKARGLLIQEMFKQNPDVVRSLLVQVIKAMGLTKEEARRVLTDSG